MITLAIKGHATRGEEVIKILEMLGGNNQYAYVADSDCFAFYISNETGTIYYDWVHSCYEDEGTLVFTLEEFLEKFPYKVGDKVLYKIYNVYSSIKKMTWNEEKEQVIYRLDSQKLWVATADELTKGNIIRDSEYSGAIGTTEPTHKLEVKQNTIIAHGMTQCDKVEFSGKYMLPKGTDRLEIVVNDDCEVLVEDGKAYVVRKKIKHRRFIVDVTIPYGDEYKDAEELQETIQEIFDCLCDDKGRCEVKVEYINENDK